MSEAISKEISALINFGTYKSEKELFKDAFRTLLRSKPHLKIDIAIELYRKGKISISKASEISGLSIEDFKEVLREKKIERIAFAPKKSKLKKEMNLIRGEE